MERAIYKRIRSSDALVLQRMAPRCDLRRPEAGPMLKLRSKEGALCLVSVWMGDLIGTPPGFRRACKKQAWS